MLNADGRGADAQVDGDLATQPDALDQCLADAKAEVLLRCGVRVSENDPVMAVLVAQDVLARRHASLVEAAVSSAADRFGKQLDRREAQMRERFERHLADAARDGIDAIRSAALDQRAEFIGALNTLTERQERAARTAGRASRAMMIAALIGVIAVAVAMLNLI